MQGEGLFILVNSISHTITKCFFYLKEGEKKASIYRVKAQRSQSNLRRPAGYMDTDESTHKQDDKNIQQD